MIYEIIYYDSGGDIAYYYAINPKSFLIIGQTLCIDNKKFSLLEDDFAEITITDNEKMLQHIHNYSKGLEGEKKEDAE